MIHQTSSKVPAKSLMILAVHSNLLSNTSCYDLCHFVCEFRRGWRYLITNRHPTTAPFWKNYWITEVSHSNGPFVFQPGHLVFTNCFSKQVIKTADFATLKIWLQSDHWFKKYGKKVNFQSAKSKLFVHNFWSSCLIDPKFRVWKYLQYWWLLC